MSVVDDGCVYDKPALRVTSIVLDDAYNQLRGCHFTVRGSYPYSCGDNFGKGGSVISHNKRNAHRIRGKSNMVNNCTFIIRSYGHGIFFQGAEDPMVDGCNVEGELRFTDEVLAKEGTGSIADNVDFRSVFGFNPKDITGNYYFSLQEDRMRTYHADETIINGVEYDRGVINATVKNSTVVEMRSGVAIGWASGTKHVENCTTIACESGYWVGSDAKVINCKGDSSNGALPSEDVGRSNSDIDLTLFDYYVTPLNGKVTRFYYAGFTHNVTLYDGTTSLQDDIELDIRGQRLAHRFLEASCSTNPALNCTAGNITINNLTGYPHYLRDQSSIINGQSCEAIPNEGFNNPVALVDCDTASTYREGIYLASYASPGIYHEVYTGTFDEITDFDELSPIKTGMADGLEITATDSSSEFAVLSNGSLKVPASDRFTFYAESDDALYLSIDGHEQINLEGIMTTRGSIPKNSSQIFIELDWLTVGVHLVMFQGDGVQKTIKIIKDK